MANDLNNCQFIGRLGRDPEARALTSGDVVANFSIAVGWKSKEKEGTEWVNVVAFGKLAEIIQQYCRKGHQVFIAGSMRTRKWQDKDGNDRYSTEIVANQMQMLGSKGEGSDRAAQQAESYGYGGSASTSNSSSAGTADFNDDIPF